MAQEREEEINKKNEGGDPEHGGNEERNGSHSTSVCCRGIAPPLEGLASLRHKLRSAGSSVSLAHASTPKGRKWAANGSDVAMWGRRAQGSGRDTGVQQDPVNGPS